MKVVKTYIHNIHNQPYSSEYKQYKAQQGKDTETPHGYHVFLS